MGPNRLVGERQKTGNVRNKRRARDTRHLILIFTGNTILGLDVRPERLTLHCLVEKV